MTGSPPDSRPAPLPHPPDVRWEARPWGAPLLVIAVFVTWFVVGQCLPGVVLVIAEAVRTGGDVSGADQAVVDGLIWLLLWAGLTAVGLVALVRAIGRLAPASEPAGGPGPVRWLVWTGLWSTLCLAGSIWVVSPALEAAGWEVEEQPMLVEAIGTGGPFLFVVLAIVAPIYEEFLCRRFLFETVRRGNGVTLAWVASIVVFAAIHMHLPALPLYVWMAICFTAAYQLTGSVWSAATVHAVNNGFAVGTMMWGGT